MTKIEKQVTIYTSFCHGVLHAIELIYGSLLASIALEFGATFLTLGILANIMGFFFGAAA